MRPARWPKAVYRLHRRRCGVTDATPDDNLGLLARSLSNKEFGRELGVAEETVKLDVTTLIETLVGNNRILADVKAAFLGLIPDHPNTPYETGGGRPGIADPQ